MSRMLLMLSLVVAACGCSTCQNCFDGAYPYYGGIAPRTDRFCGRVGSAFAPAGPDVGALAPYQRETQSVGLSGGVKSSSDKESPTPAEEPTPENGIPLDNIDLPLTPSDA